MRVLVVEDDLDYSATLCDALRDLDVTPITATSRDEAIQAIEDEWFELILCDLKLPTERDKLDDAREHGLAVIAHVQKHQPGTPIIVHSAYADRNFMPEVIERARHDDFLGRNHSEPLVAFIHKGDLPACVHRVKAIKEEVDKLRAISFSTGTHDLDLLAGEERALRIFARRHRSRIVRVAPLAGGLSSTRVLGVNLLGDDGQARGFAVAKIGAIEEVHQERQRYDEFVTPLLEIGAYAIVQDEVTAGAGNIGALFYRVSEESESLFSCISDDQTAGRRLVEDVRRATAPWYRGPPMRSVRTRDLRREMIADELAEDLAEEYLNDVPWEEFEAREFRGRQCVQHGDMHGENILVPEDGRPLLIDFAEARETVASLDALVLELSLLFHPEGRRLCEDWPSLDQALRWHRLDEYVTDCPVEGFVRACREWAMEDADNDRAVYSNLYVYALRQLKYEGTDKALACSLIEAAIAGFSAT